MPRRPTRPWWAIDENGYARTVKVTGIFFTGNQDVTYDVKLSSYDKGVEITAPSS